MAQTTSAPQKMGMLVERARSTPRKVLIIDREEDSQEMIEALEAEGFKVIHAPDPTAGLSKATEPDLSLIVVAEHMLAGRDQEALPPLCTISESPIVLLYSGGQGVRAQAKHVGAEAYFSRAAPVSYFINYVCGRLSWRGRVRAPA